MLLNNKKKNYAIYGRLSHKNFNGIYTGQFETGLALRYNFSAEAGFRLLAE